MNQLINIWRADSRRWAGVLLAAVGLADSAYLTYIKLANAQASCTIGDCNAVNSSTYAEIAGIPIALLGLGAYAAIGLLLALEDRAEWLATYSPLGVFFLALTGTLYSAYLTYVELFVIDAVCPYCVVSAVVITSILMLSIWRLARPADRTGADSAKTS